MTEEVNTDVNTSVEMPTTETESSAAESNAEGVMPIFEDKQAPEEETETNVEDEPEKPSEPDATEAEAAEPEPPRKNAETRKQQLNNEIRDKVAERNALREEIAKLNQQKYQLQSMEDLPTVEALMEQRNPDTGDYYTLMEAKFARMEAENKLRDEQQKLEKYTESIVDNRMRLKDEAERASKDFPMFDDKSDKYNQELAEQADQIVASLLIKDQTTGEIIGSHGSVYAVYAAIANAAKAAEASGKVAGQQAAVKMMNSADVVGSSGTSNVSDDDDPFLKGFDRANV